VKNKSSSFYLFNKLPPFSRSHGMINWRGACKNSRNHLAIPPPLHPPDSELRRRIQMGCGNFIKALKDFSGLGVFVGVSGEAVTVEELKKEKSSLNEDGKGKPGQAPVN
jgi:hypothetical protein